MLDDAKLSALIGHIYDCVPDPARWDDIMGSLCHATESEVGTISIIAPRPRKHHFGSVYGPRGITEPLKRKYAQHMPFFDVLPSMKTGRLYFMSDMTRMIGEDGREILEDTVMYREWNRPHGLTDSYCVALCNEPDEIICMNLVLSENRRPVSEEDRRQLAVLVPHIQRAGKLGLMLDTISQQNHAMQQVTNQMANSVLIVSPDMQILEANPVAEKMLAESTVLRSLRGRLVITNPAASARIEQDVKLSALMEDQLQGASFSIPLGDSFNPSIARVIPLARRDLGRRLVNGAAAAIFIAEAKRDVDLETQAISDLYALTSAERRIAHLTAKGLNRAAVAETIGIKESTVKSHLESIFSKTGTSGQTALTPPLR
jgi:DNA-binding CsgD family transcriptional regulator